MKKFFKPLVVLPIIFVLVGCGGSFLNNAYKSMYTVGVGYDAGMKSVGDLYSQGKLTQKRLDEILIIAHKVKVSYDAAVEALSIYEVVDSAENKMKLETALNEVTRLWDDLKSLISIFAPDSLKSIEIEKLSKEINDLQNRAKFAVLKINKEAI
ncbi:MAG TPA: hypothetical protein DCY00_07270 [Actinobacteria bacterium]|nr:hypothetical protein [Actinomycetota bacterium]